MAYQEFLVLHHIFVILLIINFIIQTVLIFLPDEKHLMTYRTKTKWAEITVSILVVLTGLWLILAVEQLGNWVFVKIFLLFVAVALAAMAYKRHIAIYAILTVVILLYVYYASAFRASPLH